jgi:hypothetical protein
MLIAGNGDEIVIGQFVMGSFAEEQQPVPAKGDAQIGTFKRFSQTTIGPVRRKITNSVESEQPGNNPVAPKLASAKQACRIEISGMFGEAVAVIGIATEARPPITAESEHRHKHWAKTPLTSGSIS